MAVHVHIHCQEKMAGAGLVEEICQGELGVLVLAAVGEGLAEEAGGNCCCIGTNQYLWLLYGIDKMLTQYTTHALCLCHSQPIVPLSSGENIYRGANPELQWPWTDPPAKWIRSWGLRQEPSV